MQDLATLAVIKVLNELDIPYLLTGSMALNVYGIPRNTMDADFVVQLAPGKGINEIATRLGPDFILDRQSSFETITASRRYVFTHKHDDFQIELFLLKNSDFDQNRFAGRKLVVSDGTPIYLPRFEDIIVNKLNWANTGRREKDFGDLKILLNVNEMPIDWNYVEGWSDRLGTRALLDRLRAELSNQPS
jgi:hypothetical protein